MNKGIASLVFSVTLLAAQVLADTETAESCFASCSGIEVTQSLFERNNPRSDFENAGSRYDSLNVSFVGNWPFAAPKDSEIDSLRNLAFCSSGGGVFVVDISDMSSVVKISDTIRSTYGINDLFYEESTHRLFLASREAGLEIWDVQDPYNPIKLGDFEVPYVADGVTVSEGYAYVGHTNTGGICVIDVTVPESPKQVGYIDTSGFHNKMQVSGDFLYYAAGYWGLAIIDISVPENPVEVTYFDTPGNAHELEVSGGFVYLADDDEGLRIIDVSDPWNPVEVSVFESVGDSRCIAFQDDKAYVSTTNGLHVIDVSTPITPTEVGVFYQSGVSPYLAVSGDNAFLPWSPGFQVQDVSVPSNITEVGSFQLPGYTKGVSVSGDFAYLAESGRGLRILDISSLSTPSDAGFCSTTGIALGVDVSGSYATLLMESPDFRLWTFQLLPVLLLLERVILLASQEK